MTTLRFEEDQIQQYLERIGYSGVRDVSLETLGALHRAHVSTIPYENLDIHLGRHIPIDPFAAFQKVVLGQRGGYCYELNPLFYVLLMSLGFDCRLLSGRVLLRDEGHPFDHAIVMVRLEGDWLVDVGFGRQPPVMPISPSSEGTQTNENGTFVLHALADGFVLKGSDNDRDFDETYSFNLTGRTFQEFEDRSIWTQTSPDSIFAKSPVCTLPTREGRMTVSGNRLLRTVKGDVRVEDIAAGQREALIERLFNIDLGGATLPDCPSMNWMPGRRLRQL